MTIWRTHLHITLVINSDIIFSLAFSLTSPTLKPTGRCTLNQHPGQQTPHHFQRLFIECHEYNWQYMEMKWIQLCAFHSSLWKFERLTSSISTFHKYIDFWKTFLVTTILKNIYWLEGKTQNLFIKWMILKWV